MPRSGGRAAQGGDTRAIPTATAPVPWEPKAAGGRSQLRSCSGEETQRRLTACLQPQLLCVCLQLGWQSTFRVLKTNKRTKTTSFVFCLFVFSCANADFPRCSLLPGLCLAVSYRSPSVGSCLAAIRHAQFQQVSNTNPVCSQHHCPGCYKGQPGNNKHRLHPRTKPTALRSTARVVLPGGHLQFPRSLGTTLLGLLRTRGSPCQPQFNLSPGWLSLAGDTCGREQRFSPRSAPIPFLTAGSPSLPLQA